MLRVEDLNVFFSSDQSSLQAVKRLSFDLQEGDSLGLIGESGSGKSALVHAIAQLSSARVEGNVLFEGKPLTRKTQEIGVVFQDPMSSLNPTMKIGWQIAESLIYHRLVSFKEAKKRVLKILELVEIAEPTKRFDLYPHQLSGGMRQRVVIAIAIARAPKLLLADEPTTALDRLTESQILDLLQNMQEKFNMALLLVSHDFQVIQKTCRQVLVMKEGEIVERGLTQEVFENPKHPYTQALLQGSQKTFHSLQGLEPSPLLVEMKELTKIYEKASGTKALDSVDLCLRKARTVGLVGESGSGKSTLARILLGSLPPSSGTVLYEGKEKKGFLPRHIQMVFQDASSCLNPQMQVEDILSEPSQIHHLPPRVDELLDLVSLSKTLKKRLPHELSGGQRQRIVIARALALQPDLLIADEPVSSLDAPLQRQIIAELKKLQKELGLTLLLITHDLSLIQSVADRIAVMYQGKIIEENETQALFTHPQHSYTKKLLSITLEARSKKYDKELFSKAFQSRAPHAFSP